MSTNGKHTTSTRLRPKALFPNSLRGNAHRVSLTSRTTERPTAAATEASGSSHENMECRDSQGGADNAVLHKKVISDGLWNFHDHEW